MSKVQTHIDAPAEAGRGSLLSYTSGFVFSVLLTLAAYVSVTNNSLPKETLMLFIVGLAVVQLLVQLLFFLHLGRESKPRWNLVVFSFMLVVIVIVVLGSLWVMHNLDYHMMPHEMDKTLIEEEGIYKSGH